MLPLTSPCPHFPRPHTFLDLLHPHLVNNGFHPPPPPRPAWPSLWPSGRNRRWRRGREAGAGSPPPRKHKDSSNLPRQSQTRGKIHSRFCRHRRGMLECTLEILPLRSMVAMSEVHRPPSPDRLWEIDSVSTILCSRKLCIHDCSTQISTYTTVRTYTCIPWRQFRPQLCSARHILHETRLSRHGLWAWCSLEEWSRFAGGDLVGLDLGPHGEVSHTVWAMGLKTPSSLPQRTKDIRIS